MARTVSQLLSGTDMYNCDPNGDIILRFRHPHPPFADPEPIDPPPAVIPPDDQAIFFDPEPAEYEVPIASNDFAELDEELGLDNGPDPIDGVNAPLVDEIDLVQDGSPRVGTDHYNILDDDGHSGDAPKPLSTEDYRSAQIDDEAPPSTEIRVSSRHLILASSYFRRMLQGDWKEAKSLQSDESLLIEETEWDAVAVRIIMDLIHGQFRRVPKAISLEMLAKIAVVVDYYQCLEVVEIFSGAWIASLKQTVPESYSRNTMLWIWISWMLCADYGLANSGTNHM
ncbi:hypothetical protein MMC25_001326 [Agyrium rufum]|nr:hypothetical protein [Agyrium rufum]